MLMAFINPSDDKNMLKRVKYFLLKTNFLCHIKRWLL
jgi:hypothetical protein